MLTKSALEYVAALYGILVGVFFPLIYLHGKLYFRKKRFSFRVLFAYMGRLLIILLLYGVVAAALLGTVGLLDSPDPDSIEQLFGTHWYFIGVTIGLLGGITLIFIGLRQARKQDGGQKEE